MNNTIRVRVTGILQNEKNEILFIKHRKNGDEYWLLPGGGVDYGETFQEGLKREFLEETNLKIEVNNMAFLSEAIEPNHKRHIINVYFFVTKIGGDMKLASEDNLVDLQFLDENKIENSIIYPNIKKELKNISNNKNNCVHYLGNRWE
ncbi:MAG: NUDIX hydrolase [Fusobacteria bacterium]|nr:NUDIX hydrolase [Fusobacteriota bacterium]